MHWLSAQEVVSSNPRLASFFYQVTILTKNILSRLTRRGQKRKRNRAEEDESREDAAMIGIRQRDLRGNGRAARAAMQREMERTFEILPSALYIQYVCNEKAY